MDEEILGSSIWYVTEIWAEMRWLDRTVVVRVCVSTLILDAEIPLTYSTGKERACVQNTCKVLMTIICNPQGAELHPKHERCCL